MFAGKKIIVGVTGSIAAYKSALIIRLLIKEGAEVKVIMTASAKDFITPLTLATLSKNPVLSDFYNTHSGEWTNHVELGLWADVMLIAPASANTIGKMANGLCDNLLTAIYLSAKCPVMVAPAMDLDMFVHPSVVANLNKLTTYHNHIIDAETGELASGLIGQGRMAEPEHIIQFLQNFLNVDKPLKGKKILITAGPTQEALDPVRFISNHSSGKMGYAIAQELESKGAEVFMISGPVNQNFKQIKFQIVSVKSANEMYQECLKLFSVVDIAIFTAAVADYRPKEIAVHKIKKKENTFNIEMIKNVDIAAEFGKVKTKNQIAVGFALETNDELAHASAKLERKNFDMIILNSMNDINATFGHDTNKITILKRGGQMIHFELKTKSEVAKDIVNEIIRNEI